MCMLSVHSTESSVPVFTVAGKSVAGLELLGARDRHNVCIRPFVPYRYVPAIHAEKQQQQKVVGSSSVQQVA